ncbi:MAG: AHH domain-containing protein [Marinagarivorans sp.]|nr:AHH domain-containing protein [Marinagarivorans sp.]
MNYINGKRVTPLFHEMDAYDRVLVDFERKAKAFHNNKRVAAKIAGNETPDERRARLKDRKAELEHLKQEAASAKIKAQVQIRIQQYRSAQMTPSSMHLEDHHPTAELENMLRSDGRPKPSGRHTAHHIVPGKGLTENAANARIEMHLHNIRINDADNGVWMLTLKKDKGHWSMPNANAHREIHTHNYERWIYQKILAAFDEQEARAILTNIGNLLHEGKQPKQVTMPPYNEWDGL